MQIFASAFFAFYSLKRRRSTLGFLPIVHNTYDTPTRNNNICGLHKHLLRAEIEPRSHIARQLVTQTLCCQTIKAVNTLPRLAL